MIQLFGYDKQTDRPSFEAGAKRSPCEDCFSSFEISMFYGIDIQTRKELIAANHTIDEIKECIGADSLGF